MKKATLIALLAIFCLGAFLRINLFLKTPNPIDLGLGDVITNEAEVFAKQNILFHTTHPTDKETLIPQTLDEHGPAILLGTIWKFTGDTNPNYLIILQILIDLLCLLLVFFASKNFFNSGIALFAAFMYARFSAQIELINTIHTYHWTTFFSVFIIFTTSLIYKNKNKPTQKLLPHFIAIGIFIGLSIWFRSSTQALFFAVPPLILILFKDLKKTIIALITIFLSTTILLSPLLIFNYQQTGSLRISRAIKWHTMVAGLGAVQYNKYDIESSDEAVLQLIRNRNKNIKSYIGDYETVVKPYEEEAKSLYMEILNRDPLLIIKAFTIRFFGLNWTHPVYFPGFIHLFLFFYCLFYTLIFQLRKLTIIAGLMAYALVHYLLISIIYYPITSYLVAIYPILYIIFGHSLFSLYQKYLPKK